jgi:hypothetical protein
MRLVCLALVSLLAACHDHDHDYTTYQACYVDHHEEEALSVTESIVVCCLDHPIEGEAGCGTTAAACVTYITAKATGPTSDEITAACDEYIVQKGQ